jgi:hypothetical protein
MKEGTAGTRLLGWSSLPGAIGYLRNPTSHREVLYDDDPTEAAEVVMLADLLLRMLDRIEGDRAPKRRSIDPADAWCASL